MSVLSKSVALLAIALLGFPGHGFAETELGRACRTAAASPSDGGIPFEKLDAPSAIAVCEKAIGGNPANGALLAYYGIALLKAERFEEAARTAQAAAATHHPAGQFLFGTVHEVGMHVIKDTIEAARLYVLAAEQGYVLAQLQLGYLHSQRDDRVYNKFRYFTDEHPIWSLAWYQTWHRLESEREEPERAARRARMEALIAKMRAMPPPTTDLPPTKDSPPVVDFPVQRESLRPDIAQAAYWYERAAAQGNDSGRLILAARYARGIGVPQDFEAAAKWYRLSAEQNNVAAQVALGRLYETGRGVPRDGNQAIAWYTRAAELGDVEAQASIADMYFYGRGVQQDDAEALRWYGRAAEGRRAARVNDDSR
jgi:uncharacterized protein